MKNQEMKAIVQARQSDFKLLVKYLHEINPEIVKPIVNEEDKTAYNVYVGKRIIIEQVKNLLNE